MCCQLLLSWSPSSVKPGLRQFGLCLTWLCSHCRGMMGQMSVVDLETFCWCMPRRPTGKVQGEQQGRAGDTQPGTALSSAPGPQTAGLGTVCRDPLSLGGCVYLWEMEVSWISAWWFHLAAGMGLTPPSPCLALGDEAHQ